MAKTGGTIVSDARKAIEKASGRPVASKENVLTAGEVFAKLLNETFPPKE